MSNYTIDDVIAKMLRHADTHKTCASGAVCREFAEMLKEAWKRESEKLNSVIQAQRSQFDAEIDRPRREQKQWGEAACHCVSNAFQSGKIAVVHEQPGNAAKLPDGWKMYDKYQIRHTDGTPLKGKRYFVLRLDSDDPLEAARVAAAMSAYKDETPQGNMAKLREAVELFAHMNDDGYYDDSPVIKNIVEKAKAALAEPPRQCDVGTRRCLVNQKRKVMK